MRLAHGGDQLAQVGLHLLGAARRPVEQLLELVGAGLGLAQRPQVELRAVARMDHVAAAHADGPAGSDERGDLAHVVPDHRDDRPRAVAERQPQVLAAVALGAPLDLAHQQHLVEIGPVDGVANEHEKKVARSADGSGTGAIRAWRGQAFSSGAGD